MVALFEDHGFEGSRSRGDEGGLERSVVDGGWSHLVPGSSHEQEGFAGEGRGVTGGVEAVCVGLELLRHSLWIWARA